MDYFTIKYDHSAREDSLCVALDETIMEKDRRVTAGSKILDNFISPIEATVVERLKNAGYTVAGRVNTPEFNLPTDDNTAQAVIGGAVDFIICNDVYGNAERSAGSSELYYIKPTYGTVSRFGLVPIASSMDQAGIICKNPEDGYSLLSRIAGNDPRDGAMYPDASYEYMTEQSMENIKIALPQNVLSVTAKEQKETAENYAAGFGAVSIELPYFEMYKQIMYILTSAEFSCNTNRYDGIKFGYRAENYIGLDDLYIKSRTEGFSEHSKLFALLGGLVLSSGNYEKFYDKAMRIRRLICEAINFSNYDIIVLPAWNKNSQYDKCALSALTKLTGLPSLTMPVKGGAVTIIAKAKNENILFAAAKAESKKG